MFGIGYKEKNIRPQNLEKPYFFFPAFLLLTLLYPVICEENQKLFYLFSLKITMDLSFIKKRMNNT